MDSISEFIEKFGGFLSLVFIPVILPIVNSRIKKSEKRFEKELENNEKKHEKENSWLSEVHSKIYAYLWRILFSIDADRVYIIQPHPLIDKQYISVSYEVCNPQRDVSSHKSKFRNKKFSEWSNLVSKLGTEEWYIITNINELEDDKFFAEISRRGVKTILFKKLKNENGYWEGSLCVEFTHSTPNLNSRIEIKKQLECKSKLIADILPEYKTNI